MLVVMVCVLGHIESLCDLSCYNVDVSGHYVYYVMNTLNSSCMYVRMLDRMEHEDRDLFSCILQYT